MSELGDMPIYQEVRAVHVIPEGAILEGTVHYPESLERDEVREVVAEANGIPEDNIMFEGEEPKNAVMRRADRLVVGFRRWNSSWDPKAQAGDPALN